MSQRPGSPQPRLHERMPASSAVSVPTSSESRITPPRRTASPRTTEYSSTDRISDERTASPTRAATAIGAATTSSRTDPRRSISCRRTAPANAIDAACIPLAHHVSMFAEVATKRYAHKNGDVEHSELRQLAPQHRYRADGGPWPAPSLRAVRAAHRYAARRGSSHGPARRSPPRACPGLRTKATVGRSRS